MLDLLISLLFDDFKFLSDGCALEATTHVRDCRVLLHIITVDETIEEQIAEKRSISVAKWCATGDRLTAVSLPVHCNAVPFFLAMTSHKVSRKIRDTYS